MPKRFNPNSKLGQIRLQDIQKRRQTQPIPSTSTTQPTSSSHDEAHVDTSTGAGKYQQLIDFDRSLTEKQKSNIDNGIVKAHYAMKWSLDNFTGTAISPLLNPYTGSDSSVLTYPLKAELLEEIRANMRKLYNANYVEKEKMVRILISTPEGPSAKNENVILWAREQEPALYEIFVNESFLSITRFMYGIQKGKRTIPVMQLEAAEAAIKKIQNAYDEARKARSKSRVR